ncbi:MAG: aldo/keto reductase [Alphaproteobacteria bacterium]|nr:aldo/keto reductase [Alphaproteobacteria bacterium]
MTIERIDLVPGYSISRLLKGGWQLSSGHSEGWERGQAIKDMAAFVEAGFTTFDCADHYLGVEQMIGDFCRDHPSLASKVQIHTKYVPDFDALARIKRTDTVRIIDRSLQRLGVERLDLVQYYWWDWNVAGAVDVALTLKDLQREGKIRLIGVTNFTTPQLRTLVDAGVPVAANQLQYSLVDNRPERQQIDYCRRQGIALLTYGHLLGGFIGEDWLGKSEPQEPFANRSLRKYKLIIEDFGGWTLFQELLRTLKHIGDRQGVGLGEVALRWTLDRPGVAGCIVGATSKRHLARNVEVVRIALTAADRAALAAVCNRREGPTGDCYELENEASGRHGRIMRRNQNALEDRPWPG